MLGDLNPRQRASRFTGRGPRIDPIGTSDSGKESRNRSEDAMPKLMLDIGTAGSGPGHTRAVEAYLSFKEALLTRFLDSPDIYYTIKTGKTAQIEAHMRTRFLYEQRIAQGYTEELERQLKGTAAEESIELGPLQIDEDANKVEPTRNDKTRRLATKKMTAEPEPDPRPEAAAKRTAVDSKGPSSESSDASQTELRKQIHEQANASGDAPFY